MPDRTAIDGDAGIIAAGKNQNITYGQCREIRELSFITPSPKYLMTTSSSLGQTTATAVEP
jgi:hypothetical protein